MQPPLTPTDWLPPDKRAAVCFTIDDVHPGTSADAYEAGGDLDKGALRHVAWLLERHPKLHVTLFVAADWREISAFPTRRLLKRIPWLRDRVFLTRVLPRGTMQLDRHPAFVAYLQSLPRTHIGFHGLYHVHPGLKHIIEFQDESREECRATLQRAKDIFEAAGIDYTPGMCPPAWNAPPALVEAMADVGMTFLASARDVRTPISHGARTNMSGMKGRSLLYPELLPGGRLVHLTSNFAANNPVERAIDIVERGGLLAVKAHIVKFALGFMAIDGVDDLYMNYLDRVFTELDRRYGDALWWTSMGQVAERVMAQRAADARSA